MRKVLVFWILFGVMLTLAGCATTMHTVTFDSVGGTTVEAIQVKDKNTLTLPVPTKEGHTFLGWFMGTAQDASEFTQSTQVIEDVTLVARWTINAYTISFDSGGGSPVMSITQDYGTIVNAPDDPAKEGHKFIGWHADMALTTPYVFTTIPAENITLYAKWQEADEGPNDLAGLLTLLNSPTLNITIEITMTGDGDETVSMLILIDGEESYTQTIWSGISFQVEEYIYREEGTLYKRWRQINEGVPSSWSSGSVTDPLSIFGLYANPFQLSWFDADGNTYTLKLEHAEDVFGEETGPELESFVITVSPTQTMFVAIFTDSEGREVIVTHVFKDLGITVIDIPDFD